MVIHADGSPVSRRMDHPIRSRCARFYGHFLHRAVRFAGFLHKRGTDPAYACLVSEVSEVAAFMLGPGWTQPYVAS